MYADDTVLFTHTRTKELATSKLSSAACNSESRVFYNLSKTVCMYFTVREQNSVNLI